MNNRAICPDNKVTLSLYTDECDLRPRTRLIAGTASVPSLPCELAVAELRNAPALVEGVKYWVVATTSGNQAGLDALWHASNNAQFGLYPVAGGWIQLNGGTPGFLVQ